MQLWASGRPRLSQTAKVPAGAPPHRAGLSITHIYTVNDNSGNVGDRPGLVGRVLLEWWSRSGRTKLPDHAQPFNLRLLPGLVQQSDGRLVHGCGVASCTQAADLNVGGVDLTVNEKHGPMARTPRPGCGRRRGGCATMAVGLLRRLAIGGLHALSASINGQAVTLGPGAAVGRDSSTWHQCAGASASPTIQTADYGQGAMPLTIDGCDAAGACTGGWYTRTIQVDNTRPSVSLQSPGDAPVTAGTQYVTATADGSPSGIAEIDCNVDGGPTQRYQESGAQQPTAQVAVSGLGVHTIQCSADNTAVAQDGTHGWSMSPAMTTLKIGEPTASAISFGTVIDGLRCKRVLEHVRVPAHWVTVRRHHKLVRVHQRARTKVVKVVRCHPRTARRRVTVWVTVRRHGKKVRVRRKKLVRVVLPPRLVGSTTRRVRYGHGTAVSGWLGTYDGIALGGQTVRVLTAPDNGLGQFSQAATVTTAANGGWSADASRGSVAARGSRV